MSATACRTKMPRIVLALLASMVTMTLPAGEPSPQARLVVGIMVDGLDNDYLELLQSRFGQGGFNRLAREGLVLLNADYGTPVDATAATAMIFTGASPAVSGIGGAEVYDREAHRATGVFHDPTTIGNFTNGTYSPAALRVSTLADELRVAAGGVNLVYSIAPEAADAIIMAGHSGNAAIWLDRRTANWASSTFYRDMPTTVSTRNRLRPLSMRLDTMSWYPAIEPKNYPNLPDHLKHYPFRYVFPRANAARLDMFVQSPLMSAEVTDVAVDMMDKLAMGSHDGTDMLNLSYSLQAFDYSKNSDTRVELMDSYIRLDRQLDRLFKAVDKRVGAGNSIIFLAATPPRTRSRRDDEQWRIPYGEFSTRKALSLLNMYLMALHGNGEYVAGYHRGEFYLNHKLLKERELDPADVRDEAAAFLLRMTGVESAYTIDEIARGHAGANAEALRRNTDLHHSGDVRITVLPGFDLIDDYNNAPDPQRIPTAQRAVGTTAPVFIMAPSMEARRIDTPVDARRVAPTVARLLRIRSPNAAGAPAFRD